MREPGGWWKASLGPVLTPSHLALSLWVFLSTPSLFPGSVTLFLKGDICLPWGEEPYEFFSLLHQDRTPWLLSLGWGLRAVPGAAVQGWQHESTHPERP